MTKQDKLTTQPLHRTSSVKTMLLGAGIALLLISLFLLSVRHPNPAWPRWWMIRPLVIVPIAGALGGLFYYSMDRLRSGGGWKSAFAIVVSVIVYITGLWMGTVLGLDGTLWN